MRPERGALNKMSAMSNLDMILSGENEDQLCFDFYDAEYADLNFLNLHAIVAIEREAKQHGCETLSSVWQYENKLIQVN